MRITHPRQLCNPMRPALQPYAIRPATPTAAVRIAHPRQLWLTLANPNPNPNPNPNLNPDLTLTLTHPRQLWRADDV